MIVKSLSRKRKSYRQILTYILKTEENEKVSEKDILCHNILTKDISISSMTGEYLKNEDDRIYKRKTGLNRLYHDIISIHTNDSAKTNRAMLLDLAKKYIELRNSNGLAVAAIHRDRKHSHIHLCLSATSLDGKSIRISKHAFNEIKKELQQYQIQTYPELQNSVLNFDKKSKNPVKDKEYHIVQRNQKSQRQQLREEVQKIYQSAIYTKEEFIQKLETQYPIYRRGKTIGIVAENGRKYRLSTFGFDSEDMFRQLEQRNQNIESLKKIRTQSKGREQSVYYSKDRDRIR